jgi:hypothetical protein
LRAVYVVADDVPEVATRWAHFSALLPSMKGDEAILESDRGRIVIATRARLGALLGDAPPAPGLAGYALGCRDAAAFAQRCTAAGLPVRKKADGYAVCLPPSLGGAWMLTELVP